MAPKTVALAPAAVIAAALIAGLGSLALPHKYEATTDVLLTPVAAGSLGDLTASDGLLANQMPNIQVLATSTPVLEATIRDLDLSTSIEELREDVRAVVPSNTTVLSITTTGPTRGEAEALASEIREEVSIRIQDRFALSSGGQIAKVDYLGDPLAENDAASPNIVVNSILGGLVGLALSIGWLAITRRAVEDQPK